MVPKKCIKIGILILCSVLMIFILKRSYSIEEESSLQHVDSIDYSESLEVLQNPERGFYIPIGYNLRLEKNQPINPSGNLIHLRVGIGAFSKANNNINDLELSNDALSAIEQTLDNIRNKNASVIIRFAYDNFQGKANQEPSLTMILRHIEQLGPILLKNKDVITVIELGFFGPWGEMHSSSICTNENVSLAITRLLKSTEGKLKLSVRTPGYYAAWKKVNRGTLNLDISKKGTMDYQIGIYNDGYLGSETDLGTFANRDIEIEWLSHQASHSFYGGEIVANFASLKPLNTIEYLSKEAFLTHTTYLNLYWNNQVIEAFKNTPYLGDDPLYQNETAYQYIENHLGYRFILRGSYLTQKISVNDSLKFKLEIENVGFSNLINHKIVSIILENGDLIYEIPTELDATNWNSKSISEETFTITPPSTIKNGKYKVYLRISEYADIFNDSNYHCISFSNNHIFDKTLGANYIGKIEIDSNETIPTPTPTKSPTPSPTSTLVPNPTPAPTTTPMPTIPSLTLPNGNDSNNDISLTPPIVNNNSITIGQKQPISDNDETIKTDLRNYKIEYYYDDILKESDTVQLKSTIGSWIDSYIDKSDEKYILSNTENYPLIIYEDENKNVMKIYYIKKEPILNIVNNSTKNKEKQITFIALGVDIFLLLLVILMIFRLLRKK